MVAIPIAALPVATFCVVAFVELHAILPVAPLVAVVVVLTYIVVDATVPLDGLNDTDEAKPEPLVVDT